MDMWMDVDIALSEVPVNLMPLIDDTDFKTVEDAIAYNASGMDLRWNFVTTGGAMTSTPVTPTTAGAHDWTHQGDGLYTLEIPASAGTINNDTEGFGWFSGKITGVLPFRGPVIGFRAAALNDALIDSAWSATRGLAGTALPNAAADAAGGLIISDAGGLDADAQRSDVAAILVDTGTTLDGRIPAALVGGRMDANMGAISSDATAADNAEAFFDGTGYAGTGNVIPTVTTLTNAPSDSSGVTTLLSRLSATRAGYLDNLSAGAVALQATLTTVAGYLDTEVQLILDRIGAFTGSGVNTILGFFKALMRKDASNPSDLGGTYDAATDSLEFASEDAADLRDFGVMNTTTIATLASQTSFTLTAGSADNDSYNGCPVVVTDVSTSVQKAIGYIDDYTGSTKTVTLKYDPGIFTMAVGDYVTILPRTTSPAVKRGVALNNFEFLMVDSTDDISGKTGLTVTAERSIDGGSFASCSNSVSEVANGIYKISLSASDMAGSVISLKFTATGANATHITIVTEP